MSGFEGEEHDAGIALGKIEIFAINPGAKYLPLTGGTYNTDDYDPAIGALFGGQPGGTFTVWDARGLPLFAEDAGNPAGTIAGTDTADLTHDHDVSGSTQPAGAHDHGGSTGATGSTQAGLAALLTQAAPSGHAHSITQEQDHQHGVAITSGSALGQIDKRPRRLYIGTPYMRVAL